MPDPSPPASWRSRLARLRSKRSAPAEDALADITSRLERQRQRLDRQRELLDAQKAEVKAHRTLLADLRRELRDEVKDIRGNLVPLRREVRIRNVEHAGLNAHMASLEERLGHVDEVIADARLVPAEGDATEALTVLDAVRREHEQIRVRMQVIGAYEERLRRVEASVIAMYDGDHRHQV